MIIGLIGGSGTGKSAVAEVLRLDFGAYVITADQIGHDTIKRGRKSYDLLIEYFGHDILGEDMEIDRKKLGQKAFQTEESRQALNQFTRPYISDEVLRMIQQERTRNPEQLIVVDAEGLVEANMTYYLDEVWSVYAPMELRKSRLIEKRGFTEEKFNSIIKVQKDAEYYRTHSNYEIINDGTMEKIREQIKIRFAFGGKR